MQDPNLQRARLLYQQHRFDLAADELRQALAQSPQDAYAHALLGLCLVHQEQYEDATAQAQTAIHLAPDSPFGHYALAAIYQNRNRFPEAQAAAEQALRLAPEDPDYWSLLARALFSRESWRAALDAANNGLQFNPEHTGCINLRAMALVKLGDTQGAAQSVAEDLRRNPHNALSHANQGWTLLHQGDHRQALEHFRESLRLQPDGQWAREGMMRALKARHLLYRIMLRYYLWMSRFSSRAQWGIIVGLWVAVQVLRMVQTTNQALAPFIYPLLVAYALFILATWLADPVFNLALLISPFGRHLLTTIKKIASAIIGCLLLGALILIPTGWLLPSSALLLSGLLMGILTLPTAATARCTERGHLWIMGIYTCAIAAAGIVGITLFELQSDQAYPFLQAALWGGALSSFASNIFAGMIQKK